MILPEGLKRAFWEDLRVYEEERRMPYVTSVELMGYDRGVKEGRKEGRKEGQELLISRQLEQKVGKLSESLRDRVHDLSTEQVQSLAIALLNFEAVEDLVTWLDAQA
jgi:flagellar biosynthesis/type III secretory pathway protein FliH